MGSLLAGNLMSADTLSGARAGYYNELYYNSYLDNNLMCNTCGETYSSNTIHNCKYNTTVHQLLGSQLTRRTTMTNDTLFVVNDNGSVADTTDKGLEAAKDRARALATKHQAKFYVVKPIWSCAPKSELSESEI